MILLGGSQVACKQTKVNGLCAYFVTYHLKVFEMNGSEKVAFIYCAVLTFVYSLANCDSTFLIVLAQTMYNETTIRQGEENFGIRLVPGNPPRERLKRLSLEHSGMDNATALARPPWLLLHSTTGVARAVVEGIAASDVNAMIVYTKTRTENLQNELDDNAKYGSTPRVRGVISSDHDAPLHVPSTKKCTASSSCRKRPSLVSL